VNGDWEVLDSDRELFHRELRSFVPDRIFDAHCHLYQRSQFRGDVPELVAGGPERAGIEAFRRHMDEIHPGRRCDGLFFGYPHARIDMDAANGFVADEIANQPACRAQMLIRPEMTAEFIGETVRSHGFAGLKCYHVYAAESPTFDAPITSYLPEEHVRVAHDQNLSITLHMVRARAMADPSNQQIIRHYCERYPRMRMILAHAARGFNPHHTVEGIESLRGLTNVWCDTSAVTEAGAFEAIVRTLGVNRLLYGADFPISHMRARCVALGDSFLWISASNTQFEAAYGVARPALVAFESLRALKLACWNLRLADGDLEKIFYGNAGGLYALDA
jgi:predicted TIM-barrel fold metal-dependent hydrolase